jgi:pimeloyl-ACP methyl ester carboxylesterase
MSRRDVRAIDSQGSRGDVIRTGPSVRRSAAALALTSALAGSGPAARDTNPKATDSHAGKVPAPVKPAKIEDFAPPEEFVTVGTVKTHFVRKGAAGRPVVLVHGFGASTYSWRATIEALAPRFRVYALDLKGFGLTAKPKDGKYNAEAYTRHLLGFLDAMGLDRPVLVGHSMGGAIVARLALEHPGRVGGLVLEAPVPVSMSRGRDALKKAGAGGNGDAREIATAADMAAALNPAVAARMLPALLRSAITRQTVEAGLKASYHDPKLVTPELVEIYYRPITIEGAAEALTAMMTPQPLPARPLPPLEGLKVPALVVRGEHDRMIPREAVEAYARLIPGARSAVFAGSGHIPHEEEPVAFNARLRAFLDALPDR